MSEINYEKSLIEAEIIKKINSSIVDLDTEYLTEALTRMKDAHSFRESAAILNPSPHTHHENQALNAAKLKQLELLIELALNAKTIIDCEKKLRNAKDNSDKLKKLFDFLLD